MFCALKGKLLRERSSFMFHSFQPRSRKFKGKQGHTVEKEFDFVLVFPGLIIGIECKNTLSTSTLKKATAQLDKLQHVLEDDLGTGKEFRFVRCMTYQVTGQGSEDIEECSNCSQYLLKFDTKEGFLDKLMTCLTGTAVKPKSQILRDTFKAKVRDLLLYSSKRGGNEEDRVADAYSTYHELITSTPGETVFFWNPLQYDTIKQNPQFCTISGGE